MKSTSVIAAIIGLLYAGPLFASAHLSRHDVLQICLLVIIFLLLRGRTPLVDVARRIILTALPVILLLALPGMRVSGPFHLLSISMAAALGIFLLGMQLFDGLRGRRQPVAIVDMMALFSFCVLIFYVGMTIVMGKVLHIPVFINSQVINGALLTIVLFLASSFIMNEHRTQVQRVVRVIFVVGSLAIIAGYLILIIMLSYELNKGERLLRQGDTGLARDSFTRVVAWNRTFAWPAIDRRAYNQQGLLSWRNGSFTEALQFFEKASLIGEADGTSLYGCGAAEFQRGNMRDAQRWFRRISSVRLDWSELQELFQPDASLLTLLGRVLTEQGSIDEAAKALKQAVEKGADDGEAHFYLGLIAERRDRTDEAYDWMEQAEQRGFVSPLLAYRLACISLQRGDTDKAIYFCRKAIGISPTYIDAFDLLVTLLEKADQRDELTRIKKSRQSLLPQQPINDLRTDTVQLLGITMPRNSYRQGENVVVIFHTRILRELEKPEEPIYLLIGNFPFVYVRQEFNLLERMRLVRRTFYPGDIVISSCELDGRTLVPGLCDLSYYLPADTRLATRDSDKSSDDVDIARFSIMTSISVFPHVYRRVSLKPDQIGHFLDSNLEISHLSTYFYLSNRYNIDVPVLVHPEAFLVHSLVMISSITFGAAIEQGTDVAVISMIDTADREHQWTIKAGIDSAEWAWDSPGIRVNHKRARIAWSWTAGEGGYQFEGHKYGSRFTFPEPVLIKSMTMRYVAPRGCIEVVDLILEGEKQQRMIKKKNNKVNIKLTMGEDEQ